MDNLEFQRFSDNYSPDDFDKIKFEWNGKHGEDFSDINYNFRTQLSEYLIPNLKNTKIELIRDLFIEHSKCAKETWGVYNNFHLFAQELLTRGKVKYFNDYMVGALRSMDTYLSSGKVEINKELARELLDYINNKIEKTNDDSERKLCSIFKERFEWLATK